MHGRMGDAHQQSESCYSRDASSLQPTNLSALIECIDPHLFISVASLSAYSDSLAPKYSFKAVRIARLLCSNSSLSNRSFTKCVRITGSSVLSAFQVALGIVSELEHCYPLSFQTGACLVSAAGCHLLAWVPHSLSKEDLF
jgi:hypothetical protein